MPALAGASLIVRSCPLDRVPERKPVVPGVVFAREEAWSAAGFAGRGVRLRARRVRPGQKPPGCAAGCGAGWPWLVSPEADRPLGGMGTGLSGRPAVPCLR